MFYLKSSIHLNFLNITKMSIKLLLIFSFLIIIFSCNTENKNYTPNTNDIESKIDTGYIAKITTEIKKNPTNSILFRDRAIIYFKYRDIDNAIKDMETALKIDSLNTNYLNLISDYYVLKGQSKLAKKNLEKSLSLSSENTETLIRLAKLYLYVENYQEAFNTINQAIKINSGLAMPYFVKGLCYDDMNDTLKAIKQYQIAVDRNPDFYEAYILLGLKFSQLKDTLAISYYKNAISLKQNIIEPHYNLAIFYQDNGFFDKAISEYDYILQNIDSEYYEAYYNKGYLFLEYSNNFTNAIKNFEQAYKLNPKNANTLYNLGLSYEKSGNKLKAKDFYQKALEINPNHELSLNALNKKSGK